jgi:hypothetical protein
MRNDTTRQEAARPSARLMCFRGIGEAQQCKPYAYGTEKTCKSTRTQSMGNRKEVSLSESDPYLFTAFCGAMQGGQELDRHRNESVI